MKVVHLNTYEGNGGAGRACMRLSSALKMQSIDSDVVVYFQFQESSKTDTFSKSPFQKAKAVFNILSQDTVLKEY